MRHPYLWVCLLLVVPASARADDAADKKAAIAFLQKLQTNTGGFISMAPQPNIRLAPNLRATSGAVRALKYLGGKTPNVKAAQEYVARCYNADSGGFADFAGGTPDLFATAVGLMAVVELDMPVDKYADGAVKYLSANAKDFEEIRIAVAGLEAIGKKAPRVEEWKKEILKMRNSEDATFGAGPGQPRATGGAVVALVRLGGMEPNRNLILTVLNEGQRKDGGWGKADSLKNSDLETSYRIMRCYKMLKASPADVPALRRFIASCRNDDGGYGVAPRETSTVSGTYFAAIIQHWLEK